MKPEDGTQQNRKRWSQKIEPNKTENDEARRWNPTKPKTMEPEDRTQQNRKRWSQKIELNKTENQVEKRWINNRKPKSKLLHHRIVDEIESLVLE